MDLSELEKWQESNRLEAKSARGGLPGLSEDYDPEVSTALLPLSADSADGIPGKSAVNVDRKATGLTIDNENAIVAYLAEHGESKSAKIAASIGLGTSHTNDLLRDLVAGGVVKAQGGSRNRTYRIAE